MIISPSAANMPAGSVSAPVCSPTFFDKKQTETLEMKPTRGKLRSAGTGRQREVQSGAASRPGGPEDAEPSGGIEARPADPAAQRMPSRVVE